MFRLSNADFALAVLVSILCVSCRKHNNYVQDWKYPEISLSIDRGNEIVLAAETYKSIKGKYPSSLVDLVPVHLKQIASPLAGEPRWFYETSSSCDSYSLAFGCVAQDPLRSGSPTIASLYPVAAFSSLPDGRKWIIDN